MTTGPDGRVDDLIATVAYEQWLGAPALSYPNRPPTVVGVPDVVAGEAVAAFVTGYDDAHPEPAELRRWVRHRLADYAAPR